ncbi:MAG: DUF4373 domain-containing protein [Selenomonas sp.]|nr:DUF4373 domain-containing protein [Selenomonas sp.]
MARKASRGFDYISLDTDFVSDRKISRLRRYTNEFAPYVYITLVLTIFREELGYYIKWDEDALLDLAEKTHISEDFISRVVETCLEEKVGLLSREMYDKYGILTSHGIQQQFTVMCERTKRKCRVEEYSMLENPDSFGNNAPSEVIPSERIDINSERIPENSEVMQQSKVKEKKVKESKENQSKDSYSSLSAEALSEEEKEQEEFLSYMFFQGWAAPSKELQKFIAYNRTGGRNWDKMSHGERAAALILWKQEPEKPVHLGERFLKMWKEVYNRLVETGAPYAVRMDALADELKWDVKNNRIILFCSDRLKDFIERNMDAFKPIIRSFQRANQYDDNFSYMTIPPKQCAP